MSFLQTVREASVAALDTLLEHGVVLSTTLREEIEFLREKLDALEGHWFVDDFKDCLELLVAAEHEIGQNGYLGEPIRLLREWASTRYLVVPVYSREGWVNGAVIKVDDALRARLADLRERRRKAKVDLEDTDTTPRWVKDLEPEVIGDETAEMDEGWDPDEMEIEEAEFVAGDTIHVLRDGVYWTCYEKHVEVNYETKIVPYETFGLPVEPPKPNPASKEPALDAVETWVIQAYHKARRHIVQATARALRPVLAKREDLAWVRLKFEESDQLDCKLFLAVELSDGTDSEAATSELALEICDELMNYLWLYEILFEPTDFIRVTRDKVFVAKGWRARWEEHR